MRTGIRFKVGALILGTALMSAGPALAHSVTSPDGGSYVYTSGLYVMKVYDNKCDGYGAYGYANNTGHRLNDNSGCGTTVENTYGIITAVQACTDIPFAADVCSSWA